MGATEALLGVGAGSQFMGSMFDMFGGGSMPTAFIPPEVRDAFIEGSSAATQGLSAIPQLGFGPVGATFAESQGRIEGMTAPEPTIDADQMAMDIVAAAQEIAAPQEARTAREFREASGAFGPSTALSQARAGQVAQEQNIQEMMLSELMPQLRAEEFNQGLQQLSAALGLEEAIQNTAMTPFQTSTAARQGFINQLTGAGSGYGQPQQMQQGVTPAGTVFNAMGNNLTQIPLTLGLFDRYRNNAASGGKK